MITASSNKSFESLYDELVDSLNVDLRKALKQMCEILIDQSPEDTGRFISNWTALIDQKGSSSDPDSRIGGNAALGKMIDVIEKYSISKNEFIYIYNNVYSDENSVFYAATVSYDFTKKTAQDILDSAENRFKGLT